MTLKELIAELQLLPDQDRQVGMSCGCREHRSIHDVVIEPHYERFFDEDYKQQTKFVGNWIILT